ncbi:MAG: hypothetical protein AAGJ18_09550 [Bacteroidota bacterium]
MQKTLWLLSLFLFTISTLPAQKRPQDYKVQKRLIRIYKMTDEVVQDINQIKQKAHRTIYLDSDIPQADFDWACRAFPWIRSLKLWSVAGERQITNIDAIVHLDSLKILSLTSLKKTKETPLDLQPLASLTAVTEIDFQGTHLKNTAPLGALKKLQKINFYYSHISSLDFLCQTPKVKELNLTGPKHTFTNYDPIACLKELEVLNVYSNPQATDANLDTLRVLTSLREISMPYNKQVTTLDFLANNQNLETISCNKCSRLSDFSVVPNFKNLKSLVVGGSRLKSLDVLQGLTKLETVSIPFTQVKDVAILADCLDLKNLNIRGNSVKDLTPLYNCRELISLKYSTNFNGRPLGFFGVIDSLQILNPNLTVKRQ